MPTMTELLDAMTLKANALAQALQAVTVRPIRVEVLAGDAAEADAINRGQRPQTLAALTRKLA